MQKVTVTMLHLRKRSFGLACAIARDCDCVIDSDVGMSDFLLMLEIFHECGLALV